MVRLTPSRCSRRAVSIRSIRNKPLALARSERRISATASCPVPAIQFPNGSGNPFLSRRFATLGGGRFEGPDGRFGQLGYQIIPLPSPLISDRARAAERPPYPLLQEAQRLGKGVPTADSR